MPELLSGITLSQIISASLLLVAVGGIMMTYRQMRQNYKMQKAAFFKDLYQGLYADPELRSALYLIQYDKFVYDEQFQHSELEHHVDRLLTFADLVCDLFAQSVITAHEMEFFTYEFYRIYKNTNVQTYLDTLKARYTNTGHDIEPFPAFVAYCETMLRQRGQAGIRLVGNLRFNLESVAALGRRRG